MQELSENSKKAYNVYANQFRRFLDGREPSLKLGEDFLQGMKDAGKARNTVSVAGRALRRLCDLQVTVPSIEMSEPKYLTIDQVKQLINMAPNLLEKTILIVLFSSACRISEILNLRTEDLELDKGVATVTRKGGRRERIALGQQGTDALRLWLKTRQSRSRRVFMDNSYSNIYYRLKQHARRVGLSAFTPHRLRHSRCRHLLDSGIAIEAVSEVAGHSRLDTTLKIYGRLRAEERTRYLVDF